MACIRVLGVLVLDTCTLALQLFCGSADVAPLCFLCSAAAMAGWWPPLLCGGDGWEGTWQEPPQWRPRPGSSTDAGKGGKPCEGGGAKGGGPRPGPADAGKGGAPWEGGGAKGWRGPRPGPPAPTLFEVGKGGTVLRVPGPPANEVHPNQWYAKGFQEGFDAGYQVGSKKRSESFEEEEEEEQSKKKKKKSSGKWKAWRAQYEAQDPADPAKFPRWQFWDDFDWHSYPETVQSYFRSAMERDPTGGPYQYSQYTVPQEDDPDRQWMYSLKVFPIEGGQPEALSEKLTQFGQQYPRAKIPEQIGEVQVAGWSTNDKTGKERPIRIVFEQPRLQG